MRNLLYAEGEEVQFDGGCPLAVIQSAPYGLTLATDTDDNYYIIGCWPETTRGPVLGTYRTRYAAMSGLQEYIEASPPDPLLQGIGW